MTALTALSPQFVEYVPRVLEEGVLYVSLQYATSVHKCACGCGSKVTLPISPARWRFLWDGERISLWPSVGNWSFKCESHYWIRENRIEWAPQMSRRTIDANRARDRKERGKHLDSRLGLVTRPGESTQGRLGVLDWLRNLVGRRRPS